jgi:5-oxoprolinase (ATP-hydrolysing) subunit A
MTDTICLNSDIGELPGNSGRAMDRAILDVVSRCSIACGGHAGDDESMRATLKAAKARQVVIGAHPSYPDRQGFGRTSMTMPRDELASSLRQQVRTLASLARGQGITIDHLKPHGALYNDAARDPQIAELIVRIAREARIRAVIGPPNSMISKVAFASGMDTLVEGFADRRYTADGFLVSRSEPDAMLHAPQEQVAQVIGIIENGTVSATGDKVIALHVDTICLHGDTAGAVQSALALREALHARGIGIKAQSAL